ncbi:MAG: hypothetical protein ACHQNA_01095 [Acidimicrobiales bacterium]
MATNDATHPSHSDRLGRDAIRLRRERLRVRLRIEWLACAEEEHRRLTGRPMTTDELERVVLRYPGDL